MDPRERWLLSVFLSALRRAVQPFPWLSGVIKVFHLYLRRSDLIGNSPIKPEPFLLHVYREVSLDFGGFLENGLCQEAMLLPAAEA